jgi:hypothetical protein
MFKPLVARPPEEEAAAPLRPEDEPMLFAFVERLCACLQAPMPKHFDVHVDPASTGTGVRRGLLRISLPLVEALSVREFAGVLAHELGHPRQRSTLGAAWTIDRVRHWLLNAVFATDRIDQRLHDVALFSRSSLLRAAASVAELFVFLTRLLALVLMIAARLISGSLVRRMELDADRCLREVAGDDAAQSILGKHRALSRAWGLVHGQLQLARLDGQMPDDLPAMVALEEEGREAISCSAEARLLEEAGLLSRSTSPHEIDSRPLLGLSLPEGPAVELFRDFRTLCRAATRAYYEQVFSADVGKFELMDTQALIRQQHEHDEADRTLYRYFQGQLLGHVELFLPQGWFAPPADVEQTIRALRQARQSMYGALPRLSAALDQFERADTKRCQAFAAQLLHAAKIRFKPAELGLAGGDVVAIGRAQEAAWQAKEEALADLQGFVRHAEARLTTALCLLHAAQVAGRVDDPEAVPRVILLTDVLDDLKAAWSHVQPLREHLFGLGMLMCRVEENARNPSYWHELKRVAVIVHDLLSKLHEALAATPYPFERAGGEILVAEYLGKAVPPADHVGELAPVGEEMLARVLSLYFRVMAGLAVTAERVEAALGLPRLPDPPEAS